MLLYLIGRYKKSVEDRSFPVAANGSSLTQKSQAALASAIQEWDEEHGFDGGVPLPTEHNYSNGDEQTAGDALSSHTDALRPLEPREALKQRIVVVGGGAMGSLYASLLSKGAENLQAELGMESSQPNVCLLTSWNEHANAIKASGGIVVHDGDSGTEEHARVSACSSVAEVEQHFTANTSSSSSGGHTADIVLVLTKSDKTACAAATAAELLDTSNKAGVAVTLQNGFTNLDTLRESPVGAHRAMAGVTTAAAKVQVPGVVTRTDGGQGVTSLAPQNEAQTEAAQVIHALLASAEANTELLMPDASTAVADADIALPPLQAMQWRKALINAAINPVTALLGAPNGVLGTDDDGHPQNSSCADVVRDVVGEVVDVLDAVEDENAVSLAHSPRWVMPTTARQKRRERLIDSVFQTAASTAMNTSSMLSDLRRAGATPELDGIVGHIRREGDRLGVQTPVLGLLQGLVEAKFSLQNATNADRSGAGSQQRHRRFPMRVATTVEELHDALREARGSAVDSPNAPKVGLVATMGALHDGHLSLVDAARQEGCDVVVATVFVNPTQFGPGEDFDSYPRTQAEDIAKLRSAGVDVAFVPSSECATTDIFPEDHGVYVEATAGAQKGGEGAARPGFFRGVATVVTKLINLVQPDAAIFGQKDGQQCAVVEQVVRGLNMPTQIVRAATVRDADGVAMSSRNARLEPQERAIAPAIFAALKDTEEYATSAMCNQATGSADTCGTNSVSSAELRAVFENSFANAVTSKATDEDLLNLRYFSVASAADASELESVDVKAMRNSGVMISVGAQAAKSGTNLIDNIVLKI